MRCTALRVQVLTGGLGTYQWAAPEVLAHQRYSEKADVYRYGHGLPCVGAQFACSTCRTARPPSYGSRIVIMWFAKAVGV